MESKIKLIKHDSKEKVDIMIADNKVGHIFVNANNVLQICGFEEAFHLWGCGIFQETINGTVNHKKDIQLKFKDYVNSYEGLVIGDCMRCFDKVCKCENKKGSPFTLEDNKTYFKDVVANQKKLTNDRDTIFKAYQDFKNGAIKDLIALKETLANIFD